MRLEITDKLVSIKDESVIGFLISAGGQYKVAVTKDFGVAIGVSDMDIAEYLVAPIHYVVPIGANRYAMYDRRMGFLEEYADIPVEDIGNQKVYWGYLFQEQHIVPMNSQTAVDRMIKEAEGCATE